MTDAELRADPSYTPYQQEFLRRLVAEVEPGSVHLFWPRSEPASRSLLRAASRSSHRRAVCAEPSCLPRLSWPPNGLTSWSAEAWTPSSSTVACCGYSESSSGTRPMVGLKVSTP